MLPFNPSFRNLLRRFIPQLIEEDVDDYENAVSLWHQFRQEKNILDPKNPNRDVIDDLVKKVAGRTNEVLGPFRKEFDSLQRLYTARRRLGLSGGKFLQIPSSPSRFARFVIQILKLRWLQLKTFWFLLWPRLTNALKEATVPKLAGGAAVICLLAISVGIFHSHVGKQLRPPVAKESENPPTVVTPVVDTAPSTTETIMDATTGTSKTVITTVTTVTTQTTTSTATAPDSSKKSKPVDEGDIAGKR